MYSAELEIKDTTESIASAFYLDLLLSIGKDGQLRSSIHEKRDNFNFYITNFLFLSRNIPSLPAHGVFYLSVYMNVLFGKQGDFPVSYLTEIPPRTLEIVIQAVL